LGSDKSLFFSADGNGYVAYRAGAGFAVALGHPVGPRGAWPRLLSEFRSFCGDHRLAVAFCGVERQVLPFFEERGYTSLKVGDAARIDLPRFGTTGRRREECRYALNRAGRSGIAFEWVSPEARTTGLLTELDEISAAWLAARPFPEFQFAMGTIETVRDPLIRLGIARRPSGQIGGFVTWLPVFGGNGWLVDLMRRRSDAMPRLMDFLITRSLLSFRQEGYASASLGGSPLSNVDGAHGGLSRWVLDQIFNHLGLGYNFKSLVHFKAKFLPHWEPLYLACAPGASLVRSIIAVATAVAARVRPRHLLRACLAYRS
jgi:lysylphosphatidylglycerol synthetase-like protein (DUF2156 family)